jgi:hypothetical protein
VSLWANGPHDSELELTVEESLVPSSEASSDSSSSAALSFFSLGSPLGVLTGSDLLVQIYYFPSDILLANLTG